jgi:hypothetical protein
MKTTATPLNRHALRRAAALTHIGQIGPFLEGHFSSFKRPGCTQPGWHLTFKQQGKTHTVYVPMELVTEVKLWTQNYRRLKKLIREVTRYSLGLIRGYVANRRAASRSRALTKRKAPKA